MTAEQFTYWLQGFAEINQAAPREDQWIIIKDHLALVFDKKTPDRTKIEKDIEDFNKKASKPLGQPITPSPWTNPTLPGDKLPPTVIC